MKWQQKIKSKIDAMNNEALFSYLLEVTQESGDGEMQAGYDWANQVAFAAEYAKVVFRKRAVEAGFMAL